jgi:hypothetical protein
MQITGEIIDDPNRSRIGKEAYLRRVRFSDGAEVLVNFNSDFIPENGVKFVGKLDYAVDAKGHAAPARDFTPTIWPEKYFGPKLPPGEPDEKGVVRPHGVYGRRGYDFSLDPNMR